MKRDSSPPAGDPGQRAERRAGIGRDFELDPVGARTDPARPRRSRCGTARRRASAGASSAATAASSRAAASCRSPLSAVASSRIATRAPAPARGRARRSARRRPRSRPACARISLAERGQRIGLDPMLAREPANVEQPRLGRFEPRRIERQRVGGASDPVLGLARLDHRPVERRQRLGQQGMVGGAALDPPRRQREAAPARRPIRRAVRRARSALSPAFSPGLHRRALLGQPGLLARLGRQRVDLGQRACAR